MMLNKKLLFVMMATSCLMLSGQSYAGDNLAEAFENGKAYVNFRYRYENVDQNGPAPVAREAHANTLRTNVGYETGDFQGFSGKVEFQNVAHIGDDRFNDTVNMKATHAVVADPDGTELNEAYIQYAGIIPDTAIKGGRQIVNLGNQRFVGSVGWRQNDQTHDGIVVTNSSISDTTVLYGYVSNVNRINGEDHPNGDLEGDTHLFNIMYSGFKEQFGDVTGYYYKVNVVELPAVNSETWGGSLKGSQNLNDDTSILYYGEYASQTDGDVNPTNYEADYYHINPAVKWKNVTIKAGLEVLEADAGAGIAFSTPLATLHKFNGWADRFLGTPAGGLEDVYVGFQYKVDGVHEHVDGTVIDFVYHDFNAEAGGAADFGTEIDVSVKKKFLDRYTFQIKYADFNADSSAPVAFTDTKKLWFQVSTQFDLLK